MEARNLLAGTVLGLCTTSDVALGTRALRFAGALVGLGSPESVFQGFLERRYEVAELSLSLFAGLGKSHVPPAIGIPLFPHRADPLRAIYVAKDGHVRTPQDLVGSTLGTKAFFQTSAVWARLELRRMIGPEAAALRWTEGPLRDRREESVPALQGAGSSPRVTASDRPLLDLIEQGEIQAVLLPDPPPPEEVEARGLVSLGTGVERDQDAPWPGRTLPMHLLAVRADVHSARTGLSEKLVAMAQGPGQSWGWARAGDEEAVEEFVGHLNIERSVSRGALGTVLWEALRDRKPSSTRHAVYMARVGDVDEGGAHDGR